MCYGDLELDLASDEASILEEQSREEQRNRVNKSINSRSLKIEDLEAQKRELLVQIEKLEQLYNDRRKNYDELSNGISNNRSILRKIDCITSRNNPTKTFCGDMNDILYNQELYNFMDSYEETIRYNMSCIGDKEEQLHALEQKIANLYGDIDDLWFQYNCI